MIKPYSKKFKENLTGKHEKRGHRAILWSNIHLFGARKLAKHGVARGRVQR